MVQVDIFWSFAVGAGFAVCAANQLAQEEKPFASPAFIKNLLWLAIFFVPSGAALLWGFPAWETMQVGTYGSIPAWLVALFSGTNITQGILGFWITYKLIRSDKLYTAHLMWVLGYFLMFFILVHGWDGTGYQRFFYCAKDWSGNVTPWVMGDFKLYNPIVWLFSPVAVTLYIMAVILMPFLYLWMSQLIDEDRVIASKQEASSSLLVFPFMVFLRIILVEVIGSVIVASILIHLLGWFFGTLIFAGIAYFLFKEGGHVHGLLFSEEEK